MKGDSQRMILAQWPTPNQVILFYQPSLMTLYSPVRSITKMVMKGSIA